MFQGVLLFLFCSSIAAGEISLVLDPTGVTPGTYGSESVIPQITVDSKGRILSVTNIPIAFPTGAPTTTAAPATTTAAPTTTVTAAPETTTTTVAPTTTASGGGGGGGGGSLKSVKEYGAVGDGVVDDTVAIQSAIDGEVGIWFPPGDYVISSTLQIWRRSGFRMIGSGFGSVAEQRQSIVTWKGPANGTILLIHSSVSCEIANMAFEGDAGSPSQQQPGKGIFVTAYNPDGASHWNLIHDVSISRVSGYPGYGLQVGSDTDDDVSNNNFQRILFVYNNYDLVQVGIQTAANYYERLICLLFNNIGVWHVAGTMTIDNCNIFGSATATDDVRIETTALEFITRGNYHELLYNRTTATAYHFVSGTRFWNSAVINARILTVLDVGGAVNPNIFHYDQQGDLDLHGCTFNGLTAGTIYIRNGAATGAAKSLVMFGNHYFSAMQENIEGNWNYQVVTRNSVRDTNGIVSLQNSASPQTLFTAPFWLQANTNYRVEGEIFIARSVGTTAHQIGMLEAGTAGVVLRRMTYTASCAASLYGMATPTTSTTQVGTVQWITPSSSNAAEHVTIVVKGEIRTAATAGTWIPQIQWSAAPGGTPTLQPGSFIKITPVAAIGAWNIN